MANEIASQQNIQKGEIILYQPDETVRIEVRMGGETVWLTQQQMAELFDKDRTVIGRHIRNIYKEEELERDITCAKFAHMGLDGDQQYEYTAYNLDVIISVGYRVKSKRGTKFRQWANKVMYQPDETIKQEVRVEDETVKHRGADPLRARMRDSCIKPKTSQLGAASGEASFWNRKVVF